MTSFVVDASVTLSWCFEDERDAFATRVIEHLTRQGAVAPSLWTFEIANAFVVAERRQRIAPTEVPKYIRKVLALPIDVEWSSEPERVYWLARRTGLTAYDAAYLELAERFELPLATRDERLRAAARAVGVALLT